MNKNLSQAARVIRAAMGSNASDPAAAIAHALDGARLLVDPERSFGALLHRTPGGGWAREHSEHQESTELEQQALAWDTSCERARQVAAAIVEHIGQHPEFQNLQLDGDRILVALHNVDQAQWVQWRRYFGITHDQEQPLPYAVAGDGYRDGVRVSVIAYDLPQTRARAAQSAQRPFQLDGIVYDLARPQRDGQGDVWYFHGQQAAVGMPLLVMDGRPERCKLANVVRQVGPLTAVTDAPSAQVTPVVTVAEDGEQG